MERRRLQFSGRVQGVGFRATTRNLAAGFAVTGWVRNEPDGTVLAEVQGDSLEIEVFLQELKQQMGRNIRGVASERCPAEPGEIGFEVRR